MNVPAHQSPMDGRTQPDRESVQTDARLTIVDNALAGASMGRLRDARTATAEFAAIAAELATLAIWVACRTLPMTTVNVPGHAGTEIRTLHREERIAGVVILRAGMLFAGPFRALLGDVPMFQIGIRRDESTLSPTVYANNLPRRADWTDRVLIFDPMLATGGSALQALRLVREFYFGPVDFVGLVAAPVGVRVILDRDPACRIFTVALDDRLDERGFIMPGLGDFGDRLFGTL